MDVNTLRVAVMVASLLLFIALVAHTWSKQRRHEHEAAALLPFSSDFEPAEASTQHPGAKP